MKQKPRITCKGPKTQDSELETDLLPAQKVAEMVCDFFEKKEPVSHIAKKYGFMTPDAVYDQLERFAKDGIISECMLNEAKERRGQE